MADWFEDLFKGYSEEVAETASIVAQDWFEALFFGKKQEEKK